MNEKKLKNQRDNESGGNLKKSRGKEVKVVWPCDETSEALCNYVGRRAKGSTREKDEDDLREDGWTL